MIYDDIIAGEEVKIHYSFRPDALMRVGLSYAAMADETYHVEFARILTEKYGAPAEETQIGLGRIIGSGSHLEPPWNTESGSEISSTSISRNLNSTYYTRQPHPPKTLRIQKNCFRPPSSPHAPLRIMPPKFTLSPHPTKNRFMRYPNPTYPHPEIVP